MLGVDMSWLFSLNTFRDMPTSAQTVSDYGLSIESEKQIITSQVWFDFFFYSRQNKDTKNRYVLINKL